MHILNRVIEERDSSLESYFTSMHTIPNRKQLDNQLDQLDFVSSTFDDLSDDIESYNEKLLTLEKNIKKGKGRGRTPPVNRGTES